MGDVIEILTTATNTVEVQAVGPQGPKGDKGDPGDVAGLPLSTQGDLLYRGASENQRLGIGSAGQVLKVSAQGLPSWANESGAVTSVNGEQGDVVLNATDIGFNGVEITGAGDVNVNGVYVVNGTRNGKGLYYKDKNTAIYWDSDRWFIESDTNDLYQSSVEEFSQYPWQISSWTVIAGAGTAPAPSFTRINGNQYELVIGQRTNPTLRGNAAEKNVGTGANDVAAGNHTHAAATTSVAGFMSASDKTKLNNAVETSRTISAGTGLTGGGDLTANRTLSVSFGSSAGTVAEGNDSRLSDARNPLAHKNSHSVGQSDALSPSDIGAQSLFATTTYNISSSGSFTLTAARAQIAIIVNYSGAKTVTLPTSNNVSGDVVVVRTNPSIGTLTVDGAAGGSQTIPTTGSRRYVYDGTNWQRDAVYTHEHEASDIASGTLTHERGGLEADVSAYSGLVKISGGSTSAVTVTAAGEALLDDATNADQRTTLGLGNSATLNTGTTAGTVAAGDHTHTQLHDRSHAITSTSDHIAGNHKVFYSNGSGEIVELALGSNGTVLTSNGATSAPSFAAASGGVSAVGASAADILSVSGSDLVADDPNADRLVFWDDSAGALKYLTAGSGLTITDTTITASGGVGGGSGSVDNAIIRADGTDGSTVQSSDINILDATTSTQNNVAITNEHSGQANSALVLTPKGTGAFIVGARPTGAATTGNARGANATDLQQVRSAATQVASGANSGIMCGAFNTNAGLGAFLGGGDSCNISSNGSYAFLGGGDGNSITAYNASIVGGFSNVASNQYATAWGYDNTASGISSTAFGVRALADRESLLAVAGGRFAADGDSQRIRAVLRGKTTTNSAVELFMGINGNVRLTVASGKVMAMLINIVGVKSDGSAVAHYVREYSIKNVGGTTSEVSAAATVGTDTASSTSITLSANDTNDALKIECTGIASETWRWVASVDAVEVAYGT